MESMLDTLLLSQQKPYKQIRHSPFADFVYFYLLQNNYSLLMISFLLKQTVETDLQVESSFDITSFLSLLRVSDSLQ